MNYKPRVFQGIAYVSRQDSRHKKSHKAVVGSLLLWSSF